MDERTAFDAVAMVDYDIAKELLQKDTDALCQCASDILEVFVSRGLVERKAAWVVAPSDEG